MDYDYFGDAENDTAKVTALIRKDKQTGMIWGNVSSTKGPGDTWMIKKVEKDLELLGRANTKLKTDGEPSLVAVQGKIIAARAKGSTIPENPPAYNPESNGCIEKGVQDFDGQLRCIKIALEGRIGQEIDAAAPVIEWAVQHTGFVVSRFRIGHCGKAPWERLTGKTWHRPVVEFCERVHGKIARQEWNAATEPRTPRQNAN